MNNNDPILYQAFHAIYLMPYSDGDVESVVGCGIVAVGDSKQKCVGHWLLVPVITLFIVNVSFHQVFHCKGTHNGWSLLHLGGNF